MTKPRVTVTLGHAGQVVRRDQLNGGNDAQLFSGRGKRSFRDRLRSNGESFSYPGGKRKHGVSGVLRPDKQIGKNDLRMKLIRKKRSLQNQHGSEEFRKIDLCGKLLRPARPSRTVRIIPPMQSRPRSITWHRSPPRSSDSSLFLESSRRPYSSQGVSPPRISRQMRQVPSLRLTDASRSRQVRDGDVLLNYRPSPASLPPRATSETSQPVRQLPSSTSIICQSLYVGEELTTVSGLLQSLGLSKYSINFRAEEIDMPTLRQMGDIDLKEMGIPMGPRKKILLAIKSRSVNHHPP